MDYADPDVHWAEWIAATLEAAGYRVFLRAWDQRPGHNTVERDDQALSNCRHTLGVVSPEYVRTRHQTRTAAVAASASGTDRAFIPLVVEDAELPPTVATVVAIRLVDLDEERARKQLLDGVQDRSERRAAAGFPGTAGRNVRFPGQRTDVWELRGRLVDENFVGRDELLADLYRALRADLPTARRQVLTGMAGLGKTRVAVEYAYRHSAAYDTVWWIRAEDDTTITSDLLELAAALGLTFEQADDGLAALRQDLDRRTNWLLIFDNAEQPEAVYSRLPSRHTGHVIITARTPVWPGAGTVALPPLPPDAATGYLRRAGVSDAAVAAELAGALGYLPLALAQAASVIGIGVSGSEYLDMLGQERPGLFEKGDVFDYEATVASTWYLSFERLTLRSRAGAELLRLAAFLAPEALPTPRLRPVPGMSDELRDALSDPFRRSDALAAIRSLALGEVADGRLNVHRLVQAVTRGALGGEGAAWAALAVDTIAAVFPVDVDHHESWPACEDLLSHALAAVQRVEGSASASALLDRVGSYLLERGRPNAAADVCHQWIRLTGGLDDDAAPRLGARHLRGRILLAQGKDAEARDHLLSVYETRARLLGAEAPDTLRAGRDVVEALYRLGRWREANTLHEGLLAAFRARLGPDHPEMVTAVAYQATLWRSAGRYTEARALEEDVLAARQRLLGPDHPRTLDAQANLATTLYDLGDYSRARSIEEHVLAARHRILGPEHPFTINAHANLAATLNNLGDHTGARTIYEQVLATRQRILGPEHPRTLDAHASLGATLNELGHHAEARTICEYVLATRQRILGPEHPHTLNAHGSLASTLNDLGHYADARTICEHVLSTRQRNLGPEHPDTLDAQANLATTLNNVGEHAAARTIYEQVIAARQRILGSEHPSTIDCQASLAAVLLSLGEAKAARDLLRPLLGVSERALGGRVQLTSRIAYWLISALRVLGDARAMRPIELRYLAWLRKVPDKQLSAIHRDIKASLWSH